MMLMVLLMYRVLLIHHQNIRLRSMRGLEVVVMVREVLVVVLLVAVGGVVLVDGVHAETGGTAVSGRDDGQEREGAQGRGQGEEMRLHLGFGLLLMENEGLVTGLDWTGSKRGCSSPGRVKRKVQVNESRVVEEGPRRVESLGGRADEEAKDRLGPFGRVVGR